MNHVKLSLILGCFISLSAMVWSQYPAVYTVDSDTLHYYHFTENGLDEAAGNPVNLTFQDGAMAADYSAGGFGTALNTADGVSGDGPMAVAENADSLTVADFVGSDGAFTFEALIKPDIALDAMFNHMQIICGEGNNARGWQFRINDSRQLQFYNLTHIGSGGWDSTVPVPTTGDHAYDVGQWYHVAVTYNGLENTADNLKFYWTKLGTAVTEVQLLASFTMEYDLTPSNPARFSVGNEYRDLSGYTENFEGLVDEVRISSVARSASEMLFSSDLDTLHYYHFDGSSEDAVRTDPLDLVLTNDATATAASSSPEYGMALDTYDGADSDTGPYAGISTSQTAVSAFVGTNGAFTFEAMVKPMLGPSGLFDHMEILSLENNSSSGKVRGFQFRIQDSGTTLRFQSLASSKTDYVWTDFAFDAAISYTAGSWYHAAVVYDGQENTDDNLKLYWTETGSTAVQEVGSFRMETDLLSSVAGYFAVGNELRTTGGYSENFEGLIDEVRISSIARETSDMLFEPDLDQIVIVESPLDGVVKEPGTAVFEVEFSSPLSAPQVAWFKADDSGDIQLLETDADVSLELVYDSNVQVYIATLTVANCIVSDSGSYYANITDDFAQSVDSDSAELTVQGLWTHWTLDAADYTGTHYDDIQNGNDAMVESTPVFVTGADGTADGAVYITSGNGWASVEGFNPAAFTGQFTLSYWANWQETSVASDTLYMDSENGTLISVEDGLTANQTWQHVCAIFDGTDCRLYLDGKLAAESEWLMSQDLTSTFMIGSDESGAESFEGYLDDMRIYNFALTYAEVADLRYTFAGLRSCVYPYSENCDWTGPGGEPDCMVDIHDLTAFAIAYLSEDGTYDLTGPVSGVPDGEVNLLDFAEVCSAWLDCGLYPDCP